MLNELAKQIHENAKSKGFYNGEKNTGELLCLIHSEVSEALEADRKKLYTNVSEIKLKGLADKNYGTSFYDDEIFKDFFTTCVKNTFEDELADVVIRVLDMCAYRGIDIESHIKAKMRYNSSRKFMHGKSY